jgi:hypothetical protein
MRTWSATIVSLAAMTLAALMSGLPTAAQEQSSDQENQQAQQQQSDPPPPQQPATPQPAAGTASPSQAAPPMTTKEKQNVEHEKETGTSKDRLFWTMPNFMTIENANHVPPLTVSQKFATTGRGLIDPSEFLLMTIVAGFEQASDSTPQYGQGFEGYGKRYIVAYADNAVENFMANAVLPSLLHQDPRYYQLGQGGFAHRTLHAFSRLFITRSDSGRDEFNYSEVFGAGMAAAISDYTYHPPGERSMGNVAGVWGTQMGWDLATYLMKEFWPDLRRWHERKRQPDQAPQP